jgi:hypothetical protein
MKFAEKNACNKALQNNNSNSVEAQFSAGNGSKQRGEDALSKPDVFFLPVLTAWRRFRDAAGHRHQCVALAGASSA